MEIDLYNFYSLMKQDDIILSYKGDVSSDLVTSVLQIVESKMDKLDEPSKIRKKVYNVLVEALQNLYHHISENPGLVGNEDVSSVIFVIGKSEDAYLICTGNYMDNNQVESLRERIDKINSLGTDELKDFYKEVLNNGLMSDKGGGGLGMIDIARKSAHKLEYDFKKLDDKYTFYSLLVKVGEY
ncbi:SiaB family protein kinase [Acidiluteibacter ferrifornacis]|nr:SiaB family protein kinase [Acidiluteibacter ferrifornacis]